MSEGHNIYHGIGGPEAIDWEHPVAQAPGGESTVDVVIPITPGERHVLAVRAVSPSGVEERSTHVWTFAEVDQDGNLLPAPLLPPCDVTACVRQDRKVLLGFSHVAPPPYGQAASFEVFSDGGTGEMNLDSPVATVPQTSSDQDNFEIVLDSPSLPARFVVRARKDGQIGPFSRVVRALVAPGPVAPASL
jgi:hypothetical protein